MKNWFLNVAIFLLTTVLYAQSGVVTGEIIDGDEKVPLMGAGVLVKGTAHGVSTDMDGKFSLTVSANTGTIEVSYLGYVTKAVPYKLTNGKAHLRVVLESDQQSLGEVVVTAKSTLIDIAKERKTPVAVSTIQAAEIVDKLGTRELPEILNRTPSVYASRSGGGFGDSNINVRGFDSKNVAVMVNGMPVNDMEGGTVYFSNWSGLSDVTSAMQIQRGLGASKIAIASVGGTINFITRASDMSEGGTAYASYGSSGEYKGSVSYNTGKSTTGWSASVLFSKNWGRKYADGTNFDAYSYYFALGYEPSKKHSFQLMFTGAPQWHHQRYSTSIQNYQRYGGTADEPNRRYNSDWGYLNGEEFSTRRNVYHKPVAMLNWDWHITESTSLSTVLYASVGRGMGSSNEGQGSAITPNGTTYSLKNVNISSVRTEDGLIDFDKVVRYNKGETVEGLAPMQHPGEINREGEVTAPNGQKFRGRQGFARGGSVNSHDWYGILTNLQHQIDKNFTFNMGLDARYYYGYHHKVITDLLGGNSYYDTSNKNVTAPRNQNIINAVKPADISFNPFAKVAPVEEQIGYSNDGEVKWFGLFSQFEYSDDHFSAFVQGSTSVQSYQRVDNFMKPGTLAVRGNPATAMDTKTGFKNIVGYNIKGGVNYNINEQHNVFANIGYYSKQPFFDSVYPNYKNFLNPLVTNEKILGMELGYGFKSEFLNANLNLYRTSWKDRYVRRDNWDGNTRYFAEMLGVTEIHQGVELDAAYRINDYVKVNGMFSLGDWFYQGGARVNTFLTEDNSEYILSGKSSSQFDVDLDKLKVGESAQMTANLGVVVTPYENFNIDLSWHYVNNLYARLDITSLVRSSQISSLKLPQYNLFEGGASYKFVFGKKQKQAVTVLANVNNILDTTYISESDTNQVVDNNTRDTYKGIDVRNRVFFGFGRTWNVGLKYQF